jgi:hypothetical protein
MKRFSLISIKLACPGNCTSLQVVTDAFGRAHAAYNLHSGKGLIDAALVFFGATALPVIFYSASYSSMGAKRR